MSRYGREPGSLAEGSGRGDGPARRVPRRTVVVLAVAMLVAGCDQDRAGEAERGLTPGKFVDVVAELREAERAVAWEDSAAALFSERKSEILAREGVTEAELRAFVAARDVAELEQLWETIALRLRHVPNEGAAPFLDLPGEPGGEARGEASGELEGAARDDAEVWPGADPRGPGAGPRPEGMRRGPPSLPAPPIPPDTGERRLH